jgi:hypothetical protein
MNHLISKLDDVSTISTYLQAYKDLPQALSDVQVFKVALEALMGKVPHLASAQTAQPTAPLQLQAGSGEDSSSKMLESLESVRAGVDELRQKVGTARGDLGGDMAQVLEVLEQIKGLIPTSGLEAAPIGVAIAPEHDGQTIHTLIDMLGNLSRDVGEIRTQLSQQVMLPFPVPGYDPNYAPQPTPTQADEPALATPSGANHFVGLPTRGALGPLGAFRRRRVGHAGHAGTRIDVFQGQVVPQPDWTQSRTRQQRRIRTNHHDPPVLHCTISPSTSMDRRGDYSFPPYPVPRHTAASRRPRPRADDRATSREPATAAVRRPSGLP